MKIIKSIKIILMFLISVNILNAQVDKIKLHTNWFKGFEIAGYIMAKEKGYYQQENLDVQIIEPKVKNTNNIFDLSNKQGVYAISDLSIIFDKTKNINPVLLNSYFQHSPAVLITLKKTNLKSLEQLKGKVVSYSEKLFEFSGMEAMFKVNNLNKNNIKIPSKRVTVSGFLNGKADAIACYSSNELYELIKKNIGYYVFKPIDYGFDFYSGLFFTTENELNFNPQRVSRMYKATRKGWEYAFNNMEETVEIIYNKYNIDERSKASLIYEAREIRRISGFKEGLLGELNPTKIEDIRKTYNLLNHVLYDKKIQIYDYKKNIFTKEEKDYINKNEIVLLAQAKHPPFGMIRDNKLAGIEFDFIKLLEEKTGIHFAIQTLSEHKTYKETIANNLNNFTFYYSDKFLNKEFDVSSIISKNKIAIVTSMDNGFISNLHLVKNFKVALPNNNKNIEKILRTKYAKNVKIILVPDFQKAAKMVKENKADALIGTFEETSYLINKNVITNLKIAGILKEKLNVVFLLNFKNKILKNILNKSISKITDDEILDIKLKYSSVKYDSYVDYYWILKITLPVALVLLFVLFVNNKLKKEIKRRKELEKKLMLMIDYDSLTGIYNRRKVEESYNYELEKSKRYKTFLSVVFFDVDKFKIINDTYGHKAGDDVLKLIANTVEEKVRKVDIFGRWGGDEFVIVLPLTNKNEARKMVDNIEKNINKIKYKNLPKIECSFGIAEYMEDHIYNPSLIKYADQEMYKQKFNKKTNKYVKNILK